MGAAAPSPLTLPLLPLAAAAVFTGLVALARSLRRLYRWTAGRLRRWMGATGRQRPRLGGRGRRDLAGGQRPAAQRPGRPGRPQLLGPQHHHRRRCRGPGQRPAVGRPGVAGVLGVARPPGADHRRHRPHGAVRDPQAEATPRSACRRRGTRRRGDRRAAGSPAIVPPSGRVGHQGAGGGSPTGSSRAPWPNERFRQVSTPAGKMLAGFLLWAVLFGSRFLVWRPSTSSSAPASASAASSR